MTDIASLKLKIDSTDAKTAQDDLAKLSKEAKESEKSFTSVGNKIGLAFSAASVAVIAFARSGINAADAMNDLHIKTGISISDLTAYELLAKQSGSDIREMERAFKSLGKYIVEHGDKLRSIGVTSKDTSTAMNQFADVISGIKDPAIKAALAIEVLGKSGVNLLPTLNEGSAAIKEAANETKDYADILERIAPASDKFNDNLELIQTRAKTAAAALAEYFLPALNEIAATFLETEKSHGFFIAAIESLGIAALKTIGVETDLVKRSQSNANELFAKSLELKQKIAGLEAGGSDDSKFIAKLKARKATIDDELKSENEWLAVQAKINIAEQDKKRPELTASKMAAVEKLVTPKEKPDREAQESARDYARALNERNAILADVSPQGKANQAWEKLITVQGKLRDEHKLTNEEMLRAYEIMTGDTALKKKEKETKDFNEALQESQRILEDVDLQVRANMEWQKLLDLQKKLGDQFPLTAEQMGIAYKKTMDGVTGTAKQATSEMDEFAKQAGRNMQNSFADFLFDPMKDGFNGMLTNFGVMLQRMAAQAAAANILRSLGTWGASGGGAGTFLGGAASALFGPTPAAGKLDGGEVSTGKSYMVGERGPELFTPSGNGKITPNKASKAISVVNNFVLSSPPDRRTQEQMAAMAGMSVNRAMARSM